MKHLIVLLIGVFVLSGLAIAQEPWEKGAEEYILQAQGFRDQESEQWRWTLLVAATHYVSDRTQIGAVVSVLRAGAEGGAGVGPWYEYTLGCTDGGLCFIIGGDAQKLTAGAEDLAAWQAATRAGLKWQQGNIGIRFALEFAQAIDGEELTTLVPASGGSFLLSDDVVMVAVTEDLGRRLDRFGATFGFSWGK
jgi:hypothetical protein